MRLKKFVAIISAAAMMQVFSTTTMTKAAGSTDVAIQKKIR